MATSNDPSDYDALHDLCPPLFRLPAALRCSRCYGSVADRSRIFFSCENCAFLLCTRAECVSEWETGKLKLQHASDMCEKQSFDRSLRVLLDAFEGPRKGSRNPTLRTVALYHLASCMPLYRQAGQEMDEFFRSLRNEDAQQRLADMKLYDTTKKIAVSTLGRDAMALLDRIGLNNLGSDTMAELFFAFFALNATAAPDAAVQLMQFFKFSSDMVTAKLMFAMHYTPETRLKLREEAEDTYNAVVSPIVMVNFYADDKGVPKNEPFLFAAGAFQASFEDELRLASVAPINVAYFITLVCPTDPVPGSPDVKLRRSATVRLLVRLAGTEAAPTMCIFQEHSDFYTMMHWISGELVTKESRESGLTIVANEPADYDALHVGDNAHPRVKEWRIPGAKAGDPDQPISFKTYARSQRKNFVTPKNIFTGVIRDLVLMRRFFNYCDALVRVGDSPDDVKRRHVTYTTLTGVKVPQDAAHAFAQPFTAICVRANLALV